MSLRARVSRVDDYSGELTQALEKLEIEHSRGVLDRDQQADFLVDLHKAVAVRDLRPMRNRAMADLLLSALTLLAAVLLPKGIGFRPLSLLVLVALCTLTFCLAVWRLNQFLRRRNHDRRWLASLEAAVNSGGTIFDAD